MQISDARQAGYGHENALFHGLHRSPVRQSSRHPRAFSVQLTKERTSSSMTSRRTKMPSKWSGGGHVARPHLENWLDAIRSGAKLNAPVEAGHRRR